MPRDTLLPTLYIDIYYDVMPNTLLSVHTVADGGHLAEGDAPSKELGRLQRQVLSVTEENNLLKYKVELLLDMVSPWVC